MFVCVPVSLNPLLIAKNASKRTENDDFFKCVGSDEAERLILSQNFLFLVCVPLSIFYYRLYISRSSQHLPCKITVIC